MHSNAFYVRCLERFKLADWSCNGTLSPDEIIDIFRDMVPERLRQAVQLTHAEQLVEVFDEDEDGQLSRGEFYRFCQLTVLAAHLAEQEKKMCTVDPASETAKKVADVAAHVCRADAKLDALASLEVWCGCGLGGSGARRRNTTWMMMGVVGSVGMLASLGSRHRPGGRQEAARSLAL